MASALSGVGAKAGSTALARSMKSCVASESMSASTGDRGQCLRERQRGDTIDDLAGHAQRFTARRENPQRRRFAEQGLDELGAGGNQVLAVVQHEQERTIAQRVEQDVAGRSLRALSDTKDGRDRLRHQIGRPTAAPDRPATRRRESRSRGSPRAASPAAFFQHQQYELNQ